ncbi:MAG: Jag N-terminal domain-containing protein [Deltaproteobacteria bacterium]|jgi:spoIIIJ-associated protein|nr:Jag N-terminal domain-containing protein [Deltaproteobacteria bacterium]MBW2489536.1 Jag N-terminal domain-containing protein [Deltaproteobacteria bacterium]
MSPSLEFEDKNVEMAVKKACEELNIPKEKLKHDVISYGSTGIFGLVGTKKARIRVTLPKKSQEFKIEDSNTQKQKKASLDQALKNTDLQTDAAIDDIELSLPENDPKEIGREALQRIIDLITTEATISIEEQSNRLFFNIKGGNSAILIGKRGQTLESIQYIVEKIVNKKGKERIGIQVDVEGYLEKRRIGLEKTAFRLAEKVKRTGKPATMGQMNSHDRRIVHIALKDDSMVRTQSKGEGLLRKLLIFPKKNSPRKKKLLT